MELTAKDIEEIFKEVSSSERKIVLYCTPNWIKAFDEAIKKEVEKLNGKNYEKQKRKSFSSH
jgi:hypothetical protein